ncbi:uncharacterized protein LOC6548007 isoform X3 [Drosophila erecta]|uniref:uncharacterized protein LOC6548007 isoform X3 n=1 Tax=Drosophila erecta TaxID=7220 RepID=UPI000F05A181|nr:uncharacterized protein LOC6548007 isoform X3 [Drosophila erecta]
MPVVRHAYQISGTVLLLSGLIRMLSKWVLYIKLISAANGQTVVCYECSQSDFKAKSSVKSCGDRFAPGKIGSGHHRDLVPYLVRMDPLYKDTWSSKLKRNFDEIDKASASFSILNQLV